MTILRRLLALLLIALFATAAAGDVIHLKNGRKVRGEVSELESDEEWLVVTVPGGRLRFKREDVDKVEAEAREQYLVKQGLYLSGLRSHAEAVSCLRRAVEESEEGAPRIKAREALGLALLRRGKDLLADGQALGALEDLREARELDPGLSTVAAAISEAEAKAAEIDAAITTAGSAADSDTSRAITEYERILERDPGAAARVGPPLAGLYVKLGDGLLKGELEREQSISVKTCLEASRAYDRAVSLDAERLDAIGPRWALTRVVLGYFGAEIPDGQLETAAALCLGTPLQPCAEALAAERAGEVAQALEHWTQAAPDEGLSLEARRTLAVQRGLAAVSWEDRAREAPKDGAWLTLNAAFFTVRCRDADFGRRVGEVADRAWREHFRGFPKSKGKLLGDRVTLTIYADRAEYEAAGGPAGSLGSTTTQSIGVGLFKTEVKVFQGSSQLLTSTVPHEVVHALLPLVFGHTKIPVWLHEGLATWHEPSLKQEFYIRVALAAAKRRRLIAFEDLVAMTDYPGEERVNLYYAESHLLLRELIASEGLRSVVRLGQELNVLSAEEALQKWTRGRKLSEVQSAALARLGFKEEER